MIAGLAVDVRRLIPAAVARGGHVRVGLEDAPLGTDVRNVTWVDQAAAAIENAGGRLATATDAPRPSAPAPWAARSGFRPSRSLANGRYETRAG